MKKKITTIESIRQDQLDARAKRLAEMTRTLTLPWVSRDDERGSFGIYSKNGQFVTDIPYWDRPEEPIKGWLTFEKAQACVAFIVRAVNAHEELVSALKLAERRLTDFCDRPDQQGYVIASDSVERLYLRDIRNVIAKAESK